MHMYTHVRARVYPGASKKKLVLKGDGTLELYVKEPAQKNLANLRVVKMLSDHFNVPHGNVRIVKGHRTPKKIIQLKLKDHHD